MKGDSRDDEQDTNSSKLIEQVVETICLNSFQYKPCPLGDTFFSEVIESRFSRTILAFDPANIQNIKHNKAMHEVSTLSLVCLIKSMVLSDLFSAKEYMMSNNCHK